MTDDARTGPGTGPTTEAATEPAAVNAAVDADLTGTRVLLTGGTSGLGLAMARALVTGGAAVVLTGRDEQRARSVAEELSAPTGDGSGRAIGLGVDVRDEDAVTAGVAR